MRFQFPTSVDSEMDPKNMMFYVVMNNWEQIHTRILHQSSVFLPSSCLLSVLLLNLYIKGQYCVYKEIAKSAQHTTTVFNQSREWLPAIPVA